jgi:hypothetical protein
MNALPLRCLWLLLAILLPMKLNAATLEERRASADKAMKDGNWNDALKVWREILVLPENAGQRLAEDLGKAVQCVQQLNKWEQWDAVMEDTVKAHAQDWRLLQQAAVLFQQTQSWGTIISGEFQRGQRQGGKFVSSEDRDRVRSLQLFEQAIKSVEAADENPEVKAGFYAQVVYSITARAGWELQALTDLTKLPDYEENQHGYYGGRRWRGGYDPGDDRGAPVDEKGEPVYHKTPESWTAAKSDGERFRWLLAQQAKQGPKHVLEADLFLARWLRGQFGEQTIAQYWRAPEDDNNARQDGILTLHTLKENETIARLATGVKRFTLPDEFNFIAIMERVFKSDIAH